MSELLVPNPFLQAEFVERFARRRSATDSINMLVDEPAIGELLPSVVGKRVLDVGCGLGHMAWALAESGAKSVLAIDPSPAMVERAVRERAHSRVTYQVGFAEDLAAPDEFDIVVSSMVMHFVPDMCRLAGTVHRLLVHRGVFVFSQRHPLRTCNPNNASDGEEPSWVVSHYFDESPREYRWLDASVRLYHRTIQTVLNNLWNAGFSLDSLREPTPSPSTRPVRSSRVIEAENVPVELVCRCRKTIG